MMLQRLYRWGVSPVQSSPVQSSQLNSTQLNSTQPTSRFKGCLSSATTDCFTPTQRTGHMGEYLRDIGRVPLLTPAEEIELAQQIKAGAEILQGLITIENNKKEVIKELGFTALYAEYDKQAGSLPLEASQKKVIRIAKRAHDRMMSANLRWVVSVAKKYQKRGLDLPDLIQEGSVGLARAVDKFDHTKGYKFSTYATWWIRQAIGRAIHDKSRTIRLPVHLHEKRSKISTAIDQLLQQLGQAPTPGELLEHLQQTDPEGKWNDKVLKEVGEAFSHRPRSLDAPVGDGETPLSDLIAATGSDEVEPSSMLKLKAMLAKALESLPEREQIVLKKRFGLDGEAPQTLEAIGQQFELKITRERIRQIEAKALRKLRRFHPELERGLSEQLTRD